MKRSALFLVSVAAIALLVSATIAECKSYYFPRVDVDVIVRPDGSFEFREARTFAFDGDFTWAFYKVEKARTAGGERVDITDFAVGEDGRPFQEGQARVLDQSKTPGSYWVTYSYEGHSVYGKWFYRASDEQRTFDISYVVHDAVTVHDDFAQLYWKFLGADSEVPARLVTGKIHLPPGADPDRVRAWLHTVLTSEYWIEDEQTIGFRVDNLTPYTFVEMRILFPPELVPESTNRVEGEIWDQVFEAESAWVEEANQRRIRAQEELERRAQRRTVGGFAGITIAAIALIVWAVLFARYGKEHDVPFEGDYMRELPSERQPALVGYLVGSGTVGAGDMVATIMDLARRGYLTIEEHKYEDRGLLEKVAGVPEYDYILKRVDGKDLSELLRYERSLLVFLFSADCALEGFLSLHEFKQEARKHPTKFRSWFEKWKKKVRKLAKEEGILEKASTTMSYVGMAVGFVTTAAGFLITATTEALPAISAIVVGILVVALSALIKRRSPEAALEFKQWKALKRYFLHFSKLDEAPPASLVLWEHFLVYAVTLGVAEQVLKALETHIPAMEQGAGRSFAAGWYVGAIGRATEGVGGLTGLAEGMSSMVAVAGSAMSTASGTGGGGTGGGGGGGGGGGAGAG